MSPLRVRSPILFDDLGCRIPVIPCRACGRFVLYTEEAIVDPFDGGTGWGHRPGICDPKDVATRKASLTRTY